MDQHDVFALQAQRFCQRMNALIAAGYTVASPACSGEYPGEVIPPLVYQRFEMPEHSEFFRAIPREGEEKYSSSYNIHEEHPFLVTFNGSVISPEIQGTLAVTILNYEVKTTDRVARELERVFGPCEQQQCAEPFETLFLLPIDQINELVGYLKKAKVDGVIANYRIEIG